MVDVFVRIFTLATKHHFEYFQGITDFVWSTCSATNPKQIVLTQKPTEMTFCTYLFCAYSMRYYSRYRKTMFRNNYDYHKSRLCGHQQQSLALVMPGVQMERTHTLSLAIRLLEISLDSFPTVYLGHHISSTNTRKTVTVS